MEPRFGDRGTVALMRKGRGWCWRLQWSRGSVTAERDQPAHGREAQAEAASMEPRFGDRGTAERHPRFPSNPPCSASMEPRFGDRGTMTEVAQAANDKLLQWSRGSVTAERRRRSHRS